MENFHWCDALRFIPTVFIDCFMPLANAWFKDGHTQGGQPSGLHLGHIVIDAACLFLAHVGFRLQSSHLLGEPGQHSSGTDEPK